MPDLLISILMPVKNTADYLEECLNSILQQTEKHWELIAVNDHSTDDSLLILKKYAQKDSRIKVLNNDGQGIIAALRLAYGNAKGALISRMDSDDVMMTQKLSFLKKQLIDNGKGHLATGQVAYFSNSVLGNGYLKYQNWLNDLTAKGINFQEIYKECVIPSPCWMVFREDFEECGAFLPNLYPEDYDLTFRFYEKGLKVIPCQQVLHQWRDYPNRTSRTDKNYADNRFLTLKLAYFLKLDYTKNKPLVVWGAGKKGKFIAKYLIAQEQTFSWICNNENKLGKNIYGQILQPIDKIKILNNPQLIVAVAGEQPQKEIQQFLITENLMQGQDYFFFC